MNGPKPIDKDIDNNIQDIDNNIQVRLIFYVSRIFSVLNFEIPRCRKSDKGILQPLK